MKIMNRNKTLIKAKEIRKDEFYTQISDIEKELINYKKHFVNKTIYCNCDNSYESSFFKYFELNFQHLQIKRLISTYYKSQGTVYKIEMHMDIKGNTRKTQSPLNENGDFRSNECIELLKQSDIVVTNPPFSLFREFIAQLVEYNKKFIIIGNTNALTYKETFKLIKENKLRTGYTNFNVGMFFFVPDDAEKYHKIENGRKMVRVSTSCWFTNLDVAKHKEYPTLYKSYSPKEYFKYENYDAINVDKVSEIPIDYDGVMGVPITFLDKYNPDQFEIIGLGISSSGIEIGVNPYKAEHKKYRKEIQKKGAVDGDLYIMKDGIVTVPYARVLTKVLK